MFVLLVAACDTPTGLYVTTKSSAFTFDHVELHFGRELATQIPPEYQLPALAMNQRLYVHDDHGDSVSSDEGPVHSLTYYVPSSFAGEDSSYLLAVAFEAGTPVGIGEVPKLAIPTDEIHEYLVELAPYTSSKMWGTSERCIAWTHSRRETTTTVAIVPADDTECRPNVNQATTCDPVVMCPPSEPACVEIPCVTGGCKLGHCERTATGATCVTDTCLTSSWCGSLMPRCFPSGAALIAGKPAVDTFLTCAREADFPQHLDLRLAHNANGYCQRDHILDLPALACINPTILSPQTANVLIEAEPVTGGRCRLRLLSTGLLPTAEEHIMFTLDLPNGTKTTLVVGAHPGQFEPTCNVQSSMSSTWTQYPQCVF